MTSSCKISQSLERSELGCKNARIGLKLGSRTDSSIVASRLPNVRTIEKLYPPILRHR